MEYRMMSDTYPNITRWSKSCRLIFSCWVTVSTLKKRRPLKDGLTSHILSIPLTQTSEESLKSARFMWTSKEQNIILCNLKCIIYLIEYKVSNSTVVGINSVFLFPWKQMFTEYVTDVLEDAQVYSGHAGRKDIEVDDVKLAIQTRLEHSFTIPPPRDVRRKSFSLMWQLTCVPNLYFSFHRILLYSQGAGSAQGTHITYQGWIKLGTRSCLAPTSACKILNVTDPHLLPKIVTVILEHSIYEYLNEEMVSSFTTQSVSWVVVHQKQGNQETTFSDRKWLLFQLVLISLLIHLVKMMITTTRDPHM